MYVLNLLGTIIAGLNLPIEVKMMLCASKKAFVNILPLVACQGSDRKDGKEARGCGL